MTELIFDKNEDWENRTLCVDESCVGTIGPDGRCRECGRPYDCSQNPAASSVDMNKERIALSENSKSDAERTISDEEWEKRVLCRDESCTGTIGPAGLCRECGKPLN